MADLNHMISIISYPNLISQENSIHGGLSPVELIHFIITVTKETNDGLLSPASDQ